MIWRFPSQTNHDGTLFDGEAVSLMDKAAFMVASRFARRNVVNLSSEKTDFKILIKTGQLVEMVAESRERLAMLSDKACACLIDGLALKPGLLYLIKEVATLHLVREAIYGEATICRNRGQRYTATALCARQRRLAFIVAISLR